MHIIMFRSRNKDNKDIPGFKERTKVFLTDKIPNQHYNEFIRFVNDGVDNQMSRMYVSINARDSDKVKKALICKLVSDDNFDLRNLNSAMVSIAMHKQNAAQKKWMFDYDDELERIEQFENDIIAQSGLTPKVHKTPNGYAVIVEHGFDTRKLMEKWGNAVQLKRDDFLCCGWQRK